MKRLLILLGIFVLCSSHELFLKLDAYFLEPDRPALGYLYNGTFTESDNVITRDRIVAARVTGPDYVFTPNDSSYYDRDKATFLRFRTGEAGTYLAGISTKARTITLEAKAFNDYLRHEGLAHVLKEREGAGISDQPAKERYAKHVKAVFQVGKTQSVHYKELLNYPIEFVPLENPYAKKVGETLRFRLYFQGRPLPDQPLFFGTAATREQTRTDAAGEVEVRLSEAGAWYLSTIYMETLAGEEPDYASHWATLTFGLR